MSTDDLDRTTPAPGAAEEVEVGQRSRPDPGRSAADAIVGAPAAAAVEPAPFDSVGREVYGSPASES